MIFAIIFWVSILALIHSYVLFPLVLKFVSRNKSGNKNTYSIAEPLPFVSILMAVHNEEKVIIEKIKSIFYTLYPINSFEVLVGSDQSSDGTDRILGIYEGNYQNFHFLKYTHRRGKPAIINNLASKAKGDILVITDANIFMEITTLYEIVKHFKNEEIGLVDTRAIYRGDYGKGISVQEVAYVMREISIKEMEGVAWGTMMGPFGGCFAVRKSLFKPVPARFLVDDFFINMTVLSKGYKAINSSSAYVSEDVSISMKEEFRRKIRIATGNFQNLFKFAGQLWPPYKAKGFCFISHKVLRWLGPFFILSVLISSIFLSHINFYKFLLFIQIFIFILPLIDYLMRRLKTEIIFLRFITHFLTMNIALLIGFLRYLYGVKSNIWEPTRRNQSE